MSPGMEARLAEVHQLAREVGLDVFRIGLVGEPVVMFTRGRRNGADRLVTVQVRRDSIRVGFPAGVELDPELRAAWCEVIIPAAMRAAAPILGAS